MSVHWKVAVVAILFVTSQAASEDQLQRIARQAQDYWEDWGAFGPCSRSCGGGVSYQERRCRSIRTDGGSSCVGPKRNYRSCNIQDCPEGSADFRAEQCSKYNDVPFEGKYFKWAPYTGAPNKCELNCMPKGEHFYYRHALKVIDGTKCTEDLPDVCVDGICQSVGCDFMLGSDAKEDKCRECGGDGSSCNSVEDLFDLQDLSVGYNDVVLIPAGATNIHIEEAQASDNYIALRNATGFYYLNGEWRVDHPKSFQAAGTTIHYERKPQAFPAPEVVRALGPTTEPLYLVLLVQEQNLGVRYEFSIPHGAGDPPSDSYSWIFGSFGECSKECAGGFQIRSVSCARNSDAQIVADYLCDIETKPSYNRSCNNQPCSAQWYVGDWSPCSHSCGQHGTQVRLVYCEQLLEGTTAATVDDAFCRVREGPKPIYARHCNEGVECAKWQTGSWSRCSAQCGPGVQRRQVTCNANGVVGDDQCNTQERPVTEKDCNLGPCEGVEWMYSDWSECSQDCGRGMVSRQVHCSSKKGIVYPDELCSAKRKPKVIDECISTTACPPQWHSSEWSECSSNCGEGIQTRTVVCASMIGSELQTLANDECSAKDKPEDSKACNNDPCTAMWFTGPWTKCTEPCGSGQRSREVMCFSDGQIVSEIQCDIGQRPVDREYCNTDPCDEGDAREFTDPLADRINGNCENSEFGCCGDDVTAASGPFLQGCPPVTYRDCAESRYGCCEDGETPASGLNYEGCTDDPIDPNSCKLSKFGCCSDGVTAALGQYGAGCPGSNVVVNCQETLFGCCPNGIDAAKGRNYAGCTSEEAKQEICAQPRKPGSCRAFITKWYFDQSYGTCTRFWYGGCEGNANNFDTEDECIEACVGSDPDPPQEELCSQSYEVGPCRGQIPSWYFDPEADDGHGECKQFMYGGCRGNKNRFREQSVCEHTCGTLTRDPCSLPKDEGNCDGSHPRYYFNQDTQTCDEFTYTGCLGNPNRFTDKAECESRCNVVPEVIPPKPKPKDRKTDICKLPVAVGPCRAQLPKFYYNFATERCERFSYGGCRGNENRFDKLEECERQCGRSAPEMVDPVCSLPKDTGPCKALLPHWYFDQALGTCVQFNYGGCEGNGNRFKSQDECRSACGQAQTGDICSLPGDPGPCRAAFPRWHYDQEQGTCAEFLYGGCEGNANQFRTREECAAACSHMNAGSGGSGSNRRAAACEQTRQKYLSESRGIVRGRYIPQCREDGSYEPIQCHGTTGYCWCVNEIGEEIDNTRKPPGTQKPNCEGHKENTQCNVQYNSAIEDSLVVVGRYLPQCTEEGEYEPLQCHPSSGFCWCVDAQGNTVEGTKLAPPERPQCPDLCSLPAESGPCYAYFEMWVYNSESRQCEQFVYGGCQGNANRFPTREKCLARCGSPDMPDTKCRQERQQALASPGSFVPECTEEGEYVPLQCNERTRYCWCVNERGDEIIGSKRGPGEDDPICPENEPDIPLCQRHYSRALSESVVGAFVPTCNEDGEYESMQCHGSTGRCWCVDKKGNEIPGTQSGPGQPPPLCEETRRDTECRRQHARVLYNPQPGQIIPQCSEEGGFKPRQCWGSSGYCWCVNELGREIARTRTGPHEPRPECDEYQPPRDTECRRQRAEALITLYPDQFIVECTDDGDFEPMQCDGFLGVCWCVDLDGERVSGTEQHGRLGPDCEPYRRKDTQCLRHREEAENIVQSGVETFIPVCREEDGEYAEIQCYGGRNDGYCWCVDESGQEIPGTRTLERGQTPDCRGAPEPGSNEVDEESSGDDEDIVIRIPEGRLDCWLTDYGCCEDGYTTAAGPDGEGCPETEIEEEDIIKEVVPELGGDCRSTPYGCCPDRVTPAAGRGNLGCPKPVEEEISREEEPVVGGDCRSTPYGCCPDGVTPAGGRNYLGCDDDFEEEEDEEDRLLFGCLQSDHGCCNDGVSPASGPNMLGCPDARPASIIPGPSDITIDSGDVLSLRCLASGVPEPSVTWRAGGRPLSDLGRDNFVEGPEGLLTISDINAQDAGVYACTAYNGLGQPAVYRVFVTVLVPVEIRGGQSVITTSVGGRVRLECQATGIPEPTVEWTKGGSLLPGSIPRFTKSEDNSLLIQSVSRDDAGDYVCTGVNNVGTVQNKIVTVIVEADAEIITPPMDITASEGDTITMTCRASGFPQPSIRWTVNNVPVPELDKFDFLENGDLLITDVRKTDSGFYTCTAANGRNSVSASSELVVSGATVDPNCQDDSEFANCNLILAAKLCNNQYYGNFCCKTCSDNGYF